MILELLILFLIAASPFIIIGTIVFIIIKLNRSRPNNPYEATKIDENDSEEEQKRKKIINYLEQRTLNPTNPSQLIKELRWVKRNGPRNNYNFKIEAVYDLLPSKQLSKYKKGTMLGTCYTEINHKLLQTSNVKRHTTCKLPEHIIEVITHKNKTTIKDNNQVLASINEDEQTIKNNKNKTIGRIEYAPKVIITQQGQRETEEDIILNEKRVASTLKKPRRTLLKKSKNDYQFANTKNLSEEEALICLGIILNNKHQEINQIMGRTSGHPFNKIILR